MSHDVMSHEAETSSLQSARQMLDELDELMEKMLALPVTDEEDLPPLPRDVPREQRTPTVSAALTMVPEEDVPHTEEPAVLRNHPIWNEKPALPPLFPREDNAERPAAQPKLPSFLTRSTGKPGTRLDAPAAQQGPHRGANELRFTEPLEQEEYDDEIVDGSEDIPPPLVVRRQENASHDALQPSGALMAPLCWSNGIFDAMTEPFGSFGEWLRTSGRSVLGIMGLVFIALAASWVAHDYLSWTR